MWTSHNQKQRWDTEAELTLKKFRVLFRFRVQKSLLFFAPIQFLTD
jgi:hypothetical protein